MSETKCANCGEFPDDGLYTGDDGREFCSSACELTYTRRRDAAPDLYEAADAFLLSLGGCIHAHDEAVRKAAAALAAALARARGEETP